MLGAAGHDRAERLEQAVVAEAGEHVLVRIDSVPLESSAERANARRLAKSRPVLGAGADGPRASVVQRLFQPADVLALVAEQQVAERGVDRVAGERALVGGGEPALEAEQALQLVGVRAAAAPGRRARGLRPRRAARRGGSRSQRPRHERLRRRRAAGEHVNDGQVLRLLGGDLDRGAALV